MQEWILLHVVNYYVIIIIKNTSSLNKPVLIILITSSLPTWNTNFSNANGIILLYIQLF